MKLFCPIVGLQVFTQDDWHERKLGEHFTANFYIVGQSVLYSSPSGTADLQSTRAVLQLSSEVSRKVAGGTGFYVQIEDYAALKKATIDARKHFIDQMISRDRLLALIFCNLSPMLQLFVKIGKRFNTTKKSVYVVRNYKEAITMALRLCNEHNLETGPFVFEKQATYRDDSPTLKPSELLSHSHWDVKADNYTNRCQVIDRCILHSVGSGFFQETHVQLIDEMRFRVREELSAHENLDYFVIDVSTLKGGSRKARQLYMKSLKDWYERFPFRMYIMYGANAFMRTAARLANPFMPFKVKIAKDIGQAFELIREDKHLENGEKSTRKSDPIKGYQEELLAYIGGIDWEQEGLSDFFDTDDQNHPFYEVFQAIRLIKNEMDDLFRTRRQIQERLVKSENKYRELFEKGSDWLCTHDLQGTLIDTNIAFKREYGWDGELPPGINIRDLLSERYRHRFDDYLDRIKSKGHDEGTMIVTTATGREIVLEYKNVLVKDDSGKPIFIQGSARDITDRIEAERESRKLQEQLKQKHKMEAVGTLAGGIAHDFNNILGIIIGYTDLALSEAPEHNPMHDNLQEIRTAGLRAAGIVKQLLKFGRKSDHELKPIGANTVIEDALIFLRSTIPTTVEIRKHLPGKDVTILADPIQVNQVLMNICSNASQSMEETGGILEITVETTTIEEGGVTNHPDLAPGKYVKIMISDTGPGIDPEIIDRIFDPYFTTKDVGKGSGMGLAVVHGIVVNHNGAITVGSQLGKGSTFNILFPVLEEKPVMEVKTLADIPQGSETILFVDDEESITDMTQKILERLGYKVETGLNPVEALELFQTKPHDFDLVITDMTMPRMTGDKLARKLMDVRPDIPVIICTGYSPFVDEEKAKSMGIAGYIMKPIVMRDIAEVIRKVLDKAKKETQE